MILGEQISGISGNNQSDLHLLSCGFKVSDHDEDHDYDHDAYSDHDFLD